MKKSFKKYLSLVMVLMVAFVCLFNVSVSAGDTVVTSVDFATKSVSHSYYTDQWDYNDWTVSGGANNNGGYAYLRMGGKADNLKTLSDIFVASPIAVKATDRVEVTLISGSVSKSGMSATIGVYVYSDEELTEQIDYIGEQTVTNAAATFVFEPENVDFWPANSYFKVNFTVANTTTTNGIVYLKSVNVFMAEQGESANVKKAKEDVAAINSHFSMGYSFAYTSEERSGNITDTLNASWTGVSGTSYTDWNSKKSESAATYKGQSAAGNSAIQLRSNNNNSGIVTTESGGKALSVSVTWNSNTTSGRTLNIYGSNTAYTAATDLYSSSTDGDLLGTIVCGTSTTLEIDGEYAYIGFRSASSALYLDSVEIEWVGEEYTAYEFENSEFRIRCGIDAAVEEIENIESFGIMVTANDVTKKYTDENISWDYDEVEDIYYVVISLGDVLTESSRLVVEFTVQAYVVVEGIECVSTSTKTNSVVSLVETYYANPEVKEHVAELYDILVDMGKIN